MATKSGVNYAKWLRPTADNIIKAGLMGGRVRVLVDSYTTDGAADLLLANSDIIKIGKPLPKGAHVLWVRLISGDIGGDVSVSVGDAEVPARYIVATSIVSESVTEMVAAECGTYLPYEIDVTDEDARDDQILVTVTAGTSNTDAKKLTVIVYYTAD